MVLSKIFFFILQTVCKVSRSSTMSNVRKVKFIVYFNGRLRLLTRSNWLVNVVYNFTNVSEHFSQQMTHVKSLNSWYQRTTSMSEK